MKIFGGANETSITFTSLELEAMLADRDLHKVIAEKIATAYVEKHGERIISEIPQEQILKRAIAALVVKLGGS